MKSTNMDKKQQLIEEALTRYKDNEKIAPLPGEFISYSGNRDRSCGNYRFFNSKADFHYDEKGDTLCNWGRGMGLIYREGKWAGEEEHIPLTYEIF